MTEHQKEFRLDRFLSEIEARREKRLTVSEEPWLRRNPAASDLMACNRYAVLAVAAYQHRPAPDARVRALMDHGKLMETAVLRELEDEGWELIERQARVELRLKSQKDRLICSGVLDCVFRWEGWKIPVDVKSTSQYQYNRLESWQDLMQSVWTRKWWRQMILYMLAFESEHSFLYVAHRGERKAIYVPMDWDEGDRIMSQCELVMDTVPLLLEKLPGTTVLAAPGFDSELSLQGIEYPTDSEECEQCPFRDKVCFPAWNIELQDAVDRPDLEEKIARLLDLQEGSDEHRKLSALIQKESRGHPVLYAGDYIVEGKFYQQVFKARPATEESARDVWKKTIRKVG